MKKYRVTLTADERSELRNLIISGKASKQKLHRAWILLGVDESDAGKWMSDQEASLAYNVTTRTIENLRKRFVEDGFEAALTRKPRELHPDSIKVDGKVEAHLIALCCNEPPPGFSRWSLRMLADRMVELRYVESISHERVRQVLKKMSLSPGNINTM